MLLKRDTGGGSLMIWGRFRFYGMTQVTIISTHQDLTEYQKYLQKNLLPAWKALYGGN